MQHLARGDFPDSRIVGGDFLALVVSLDFKQGSLQGYAKAEGDYAHFWNEINGHLVDLGPSYLHVKSRFLAVRGPTVMWPLKEPLPKSLKYSAKAKYPPEAKLAFSPEIMERIEEFLIEVDRQKELSNIEAGTSNRIIRGRKSLAELAKLGDYWALGSIKFESVTTPRR